MLNVIIEFFLSISTLGGYWMVTHNMIQVGAFTGLISNIGWIYYGHEKESASIMIVNAVFAAINISIIGN